MDFKHLEEKIKGLVDKDLADYGKEHNLDSNDILLLQVIRELKRIK